MGGQLDPREVRPLSRSSEEKRSLPGAFSATGLRAPCSASRYSRELGEVCRGMRRWQGRGERARREGEKGGRGPKIALTAHRGSVWAPSVETSRMASLFSFRPDGAHASTQPDGGHSARHQALSQDLDVHKLDARRSQNAEQLRENGWLRCSRKPDSFTAKHITEAYKPLILQYCTKNYAQKTIEESHHFVVRSCC